MTNNTEFVTVAIVYIVDKMCHFYLIFIEIVYYFRIVAHQMFLMMMCYHMHDNYIILDVLDIVMFVSLRGMQF